MSKKKPDNVVKEPCKQYLKYEFPEEEIKNLGTQLAKAFADHTEVEGRLKSVTTQIKSEIMKLEAEMSSLAEKIRSGYEHRDVDCERILNYILGSFQIVRLDTGEVVKERPMDAEERQKKLNLAPKDESQIEVTA